MKKLIISLFRDKDYNYKAAKRIRDIEYRYESVDYVYQLMFSK